MEALNGRYGFGEIQGQSGTAATIAPMDELQKEIAAASPRELMRRAAMGIQ
jgi:hypothetical protein